MFVGDLAETYKKYATLKGFGFQVLDDSDGHVVIKFTGRGIWKAFKYETGKHIVQRVPPTERNGSSSNICCIGGCVAFAARRSKICFEG